MLHLNALLQPGIAADVHSCRAGALLLHLDALEQPGVKARTVHQDIAAWSFYQVAGGSVGGRAVEAAVVDALAALNQLWEAIHCCLQLRFVCGMDRVGGAGQ